MLSGPRKSSTTLKEILSQPGSDSQGSGGYGERQLVNSGSQSPNLPDIPSQHQTLPQFAGQLRRRGAQACYKEGTQTAVTPPEGTRADAGEPPAAQRQVSKPCGRPGSRVSGTLTRGSPFSSGGSRGCTSSARGRDQREGALPRAAEGLEALCVWSQIPHFLSPPPSRSLSPGPKSQWRLQQLAREEGAAGGGGGGGGCRQRHPLPRHQCRFRQRCPRAPPTGLPSALRRPPALFLGRS